MSFGRILVPLDGSLRAEAALAIALPLASYHGAVLVLLRVVAPPPGRRPLPKMAAEVVEPLTEQIAVGYLLELALAIRGNTSLQVERIVVRGPVEQAILATSIRYEADLILMSRGASSRFERWILGSTTETVMRESPVPVLIVPDYRAHTPRACVPIAGSLVEMPTCQEWSRRF